ncbi:MAG: hemerythrin domain-containing protein [Endomicrobiales bacterium]|nr:hemerythrin domain-containing protein [Endomicrobiales bacterium]
MKPRGPLMIEHRLIEKMIEIIRRKVSETRKTNKIDPAFIDAAVDFIKVYADKTHHGKEEDILFRDLSKKAMSDKDKQGMDELVNEHKMGRKTVAELVDAKEKYVRGENTLGVIADRLEALVKFYPKHIEKEDKVFFPDTERYFSEKELDAMLKEFAEFDARMIHQKYKSVVENFSK